MENQYKSEYNLLSGGRTDATFQSISFEFKKRTNFQMKQASMKHYMVETIKIMGYMII